MLRYPRLRAGVGLDSPPYPFGRVLHEGLDQPFGIMRSDVRDPGWEDRFELFIANLRGPHPVRRLDIGHNGFTDLVVFVPQAKLVDPALGARLEAIFGPVADSLAAGTAALAAQRRFLAGFMRRYLRPCHETRERDALPVPDNGRVSRAFRGSTRSQPQQKSRRLALAERTGARCRALA